jgi:hypothetical protein
MTDWSYYITKDNIIKIGNLANNCGKNDLMVPFVGMYFAGDTCLSNIIAKTRSQVFGSPTVKIRSIVLLSLIVFVLLAGCATNQTVSTSEVVSTETIATAIPPTVTPVSKPDIDYTILKMEIGTAAKCVMSIRLPDRISADELEHLSYYFFQNEGQGCTPLYVYYFLPDGEVEYELAWAYSQFNPDLILTINDTAE